jgi:Domain of unknown function (DUF4145)
MGVIKMNFYLRGNLDQGGTMPINLRCPLCRHMGALEGIPNILDVTWNDDPTTGLRAGVRRCPNYDCRALVFVVTRNGKLAASYPPEVIDFDSTNLPAPILSTLEEAIKCHAAGCYKASALMVRRLLEELCANKNIKVDDLKKRLAALSGSVIIPTELLQAADQLRLLGNDAAHIEAKVYDNIGEQEATLAIELAKELLKAVYQYATLVEKLKALQKPAATP